MHALAGVDLEVARGEMVAIMGPSGSGKSTLLHLMGALDTPTKGTVSIARRFDSLGDTELTLLRREKIGFVFQFFNLLPALSAEENVLLPALISGRRDAATRDRAHGLLERVGLGERANHLPAELGRRAAAGVDRPRAADEPGARACRRADGTSTRRRAGRCSRCCASSIARTATRSCS